MSGRVRCGGCHRVLWDPRHKVSNADRKAERAILDNWSGDLADVGRLLDLHHGKSEPNTGTSLLVDGERWRAWECRCGGRRRRRYLLPESELLSRRNVAMNEGRDLDLTAEDCRRVDLGQVVTRG